MANRIQFNATTAKAFRTTLEKYYRAMHSIADLMNKKADTVKALNALIASNDDDLSAMDKNEYIGSRKRDEIVADTTAKKAQIATAQSDYESAKKTFDNAIKDALALYTADMEKGAKKAVESFGNNMSEWRTALSAMLRANGLTDATADNVAQFDFLVTVRKNSARKVYKDNSLISVGAKTTSATLFLSALSEYLVSEKIITPFKHKYVPMSERNKKDKK